MESVDVYIGNKRVPVSSLPRGGELEKAGKQTRGTKTYLRRKKKAKEQRRLFEQIGFEFPELEDSED